ncbi:MAG: TolB family protein [Planctomycetota bacterium]
MTTRVSVDSSGNQADRASVESSLSANGRYVAFESIATNLVSGGPSQDWQIYVHDRQTGQTTCASVNSGGAQGNENAEYPTISADGRYVAFRTWASNLVAGDTNDQSDDIFVHDNQTGMTTRVSVSSAGVQSNGYSDSPGLSGDGRYVVFLSHANNLVPGDTNGAVDVFMHDRQTAQTTRISVSSSGEQSNGQSGYPSISADGRYIAFGNSASNLHPGFTGGQWHLFVREVLTGHLQPATVSTTGMVGDAGSAEPSMSSDGRYVAFSSSATNLVPADSNGHVDVFVRDFGTDSLFIISRFCFGDGTGIQCPCANEGLIGHGCQNSVTTGGALLSGSGIARLSNDTLHLTASGERSEALTLFWQGDAQVPQRAFGDGLGCMGGNLRRMFFHHASFGEVSAPQGSDLSVSARSAALGNPIAPGSVRVYHAFYRDPTPNFCPFPQGSTFNTTSGLWVLWGQ